MTKINKLIVLLFIIPLCSFSQHPAWTNYTNTDKVFDILIDGEYLWVATDGGLYKYNKTTEQYTFYNRANANLPDNHLRSLVKDKAGKLWLTTQYYGIGCFDGEKCTIYNTQNSGLPFDQWNLKIIIDNDENKWIGSFSNIVKYDGNKWEKWETGSPISSYFAINDLLEDKDSNIWIAASWGLGKLSNGEIQYFQQITSEVTSLAYDNNNNLLIGSLNNGLFKYNGTLFINYDTTNSTIPTNCIYTLKFDSENTLWLGSSAGLIKYNNENFTVYNTNNSNIPENVILTIEPEQNGIIWLGTFNNGLVKFDGTNFEKKNLINSNLKSNKIGDLETINDSIYILNGFFSKNMYLTRFSDNNWTSIDSSNGLKTKKITVIEAGNYHGLYIGGYETILSYKNQNNNWKYFDEFNNDYINCILPINEDTFYVGTCNNGLIKYENGVLTNYNKNNSSLTCNYIHDITFDKEGNLWGASGEIQIEDPAIFKFTDTDFEIWNWQNNKIPDYYITKIKFDLNNNLWCNSIDTNGIVGIESGGGLQKFDGNNWTNFNIYNSNIPSNTIFDIFIDSIDNIWIATCAGGIAKFNGNANWEIYNVLNSGIAHNIANKIIITKDNKLWVGHYICSGGISVADLDKIDNIINTRNKNIIEGFEIFPNPSNDYINISINFEYNGSALLSIYNLSGAKIYCNTIYIENNIDKNLEFYLTDLNIKHNGVYIFQIAINDSFYHFKFVVNK
ncbi:MAG: T9SS type A sorting domain-containing protein [Bacteroidales bacterium]|nr:T9SS type A sorting domain-containing protein [Bacteroidales bacterium]